MRMVFPTEDRVTGRNIIPGGQAAIPNPTLQSQALLGWGTRLCQIRTTSMSFSMASSRRAFHRTLNSLLRP